jgi:GT2 family glycosyltransferase
MNNLPLVSINILNYNNKKTINKAIESAVEQIYPRVEILIIDNNSNDGSCAIIEKKISEWEKHRKKLLEEKYPSENYSVKIKLIKNSENVGFAPGHNQAIRECYGDFILCLNSDAILTPNYLEQALKSFDDKKVGAIQGKLLRYDFEKNEIKKDLESGKNLIDTIGLTMLKNRRIIAQAQGESDCGQYEEEKEIFGADGAVPIYRRAALEDIKLPIISQRFIKLKVHKVKSEKPSSKAEKFQVPSSPSTADQPKDDKLQDFEFFDEDFFLYKEDVDLAWRLRLYGWKTIYQPKAIAYHGRGAGDSAATTYFKIIEERRKISQKPKYYSFKNQRLMQIKNEMPLLLLIDLPYFLFKEIGSWIYVIIFEHYTIKAIKELFFQMPMAFKKRKIIMKKRRVGWKEMRKWFI